MEKMRKYHYTKGVCLPRIIESGEIRLSTINFFAKNEHAVWTSTNPVWEETVNKLHFEDPKNHILECYFGKFDYINLFTYLNREGTHQLYGGLARIEVDPDTTPFTFEQYVQISKIKKEDRMELLLGGYVMGADPDEWYVGYKPIQEEKWIRIEVFDWDSQEWLPYEDMKKAG